MTRRLAALALLLLLAILLASSCSEDVSKDASPSSTPPPATTAGASATQAARGPRPVILVHGWAGSPRDMLPLKRFLDANGHHAFIAILPGEDNIENAEYLQAFVSEVEELTASDTVDIVGFSMGGAVSVRAASHPSVTAVLGLAPWLPDRLDLAPLVGRRLDVLHGALDRWLPGIPGVNPAISRQGFERARRLGVEGTYTLIPGAVHGVALRSPGGRLVTLPRAARWAELVESHIARFRGG